MHHLPVRPVKHHLFGHLYHDIGMSSSLLGNAFCIVSLSLLGMQQCRTGQSYPLMCILSGDIEHIERNALSADFS